MRLRWRFWSIASCWHFAGRAVVRGLEAGGRQMQVGAGVSIDMISIMQALIIIFVAAPLLVKQVFPVLFRKKPNHGATKGDADG